MKYKNPFSFEELNAVLRVEGDHLVWKVDQGPNAPAGSRAGFVGDAGYVRVAFKGRVLFAHRVMWLLIHREWPETEIDHRDGCRSNNAPANLRLASVSQNHQNRTVTGRVPFKGVTLRADDGKYQATCDSTYIGRFDTPEEAARAYDRVAAERFGEFARLNFGSAS